MTHVCGDESLCQACNKVIVFTGKYWEHRYGNPRHIAVPIASAKPQAMLLSDEEREKFASYLENLILTNRKLIEQMSKLPGLEMIRNQYHNENIAYSVVLTKLRTCEQQTV